MKKIFVILCTLAVVLTFSLGVLADPSPDPGPFPKIVAPIQLPQ